MEDDVDINTLTLEQYLAWVQDDIRPGVVKPKIGNGVEFEINSNFMRELRRKLFKGTDDEDAHEHVRRVLEIADLFHFLNVTHDAVMLRVLPITLKGPALRWINRLSAGSKEAHLTKECPLKKDKEIEQRKYVGSLEETIIKFCEESIKNRQRRMNGLGNSLKIQTQTEKDKTRTTKGKQNVKEPVPRDLPVVQTYLPPTPFLGHLKEKMDNLYITREIVCTIGNPEEIIKMKAQEDEGDMDVGWDITVKDVERLRKFLTPTIHTPLGPVHDKEKIITEEEQDYDIPLHYGMMQPLTAQTVHITPPDDDYVASATNPILNKQLNEFREEFFDITRVAKKENGNPVNNVKELSDINTYDCETIIQKLLHQVIQSSHETGSRNKELEFEMSIENGVHHPAPTLAYKSNFLLLSVLGRERITGPNYMDWMQNLRFTLRYDKLSHNGNVILNVGSSNELDKSKLWHSCLGHVNKKRIAQLQKDGVLEPFDFKSDDGCEVYVRREAQDKLKARSEKCLFIGYLEESFGYLFYKPKDNVVFVARRGVFLEREMISKEDSGDKIDLEEIQESADKEPIVSTDTQPEVDKIRDSTLSKLDEPANYKELMASPEAAKWKEAIKSKIQSMYDNQV
ncbi:calmodulin-interacting protein 111 isoform X1 [Tanacetum coccineum]